MRLTQTEWQIAKQVCTPRQLAALDIWRRGAGAKRIALILDIDESTAAQHIRRAHRRIARALEETAA